MKFDNFKKKVEDVIIAAHPGENIDIRNASKLFKTLQSDLVAKQQLAEKLSEAYIEIERLSVSPGSLPSSDKVYKSALEN